MKYKCLNCGDVLSADDLKIHYDSHPYGNGYAREATAASCPCGGDITEAEQCAGCGEWFEDGELDEELCEKCADEYEASCESGRCT